MTVGFSVDFNLSQKSELESENLDSNVEFEFKQTKLQLVV